MIDCIKNLPELPGIYKITSPSGKVYIGESKNIKSRCLCYLTPNRVKKQRAIYNSLIKYSPDKHSIEILELCDIEFLLEKERYYQELYNSIDTGLNCLLTSTKDKKMIWSKDTIEKMSKNQRGENNTFFGKKHSPESLEKISKRSSGEGNPNYGGKFKTNEWIRKQSISNSKVFIKIIDTITGEEYLFMNSKEAATFFGCSPSSIRENKKNNWKLKGLYRIEDIIIKTSQK
jgi:group I intron endonuclease